MVLPDLRQRNPGVARTAVRLRGFQSGESRRPGQPLLQSARVLESGIWRIGNGPGRVEDLRGFGGAYEDLGILKDITFGRFSAQVKFEMINVFNRHYFADPETNLGSPYFGQVTGMGWQSPRQGQIGLRFDW